MEWKPMPAISALDSFLARTPISEPGAPAASPMRPTQPAWDGALSEDGGRLAAAAAAGLESVLQVPGIRALLVLGSSAALWIGIVKIALVIA